MHSDEFVSLMSNQIANEHKNEGNRLFQQRCYEEAIAAYNRAIAHNPTAPSYFTNRALCYIQMMQWEKAGADCRKALELDRKSVKANYFLGRVYMQLGRCEEAIKLLSRASDLAACQKVNYGDDIVSQIRLAKRALFRKEEDKRIQQEIELQSYLNRLMDEELERRLKELHAKPGADDAEKEGDETLQKKDEDSSDCRLDEEERLRAEIQTNKDKLNNLFAQVDERRRRREVPDYLCGKISFEILRDPVITPSGITYDRADIKEHLQRVGHFDPVTRAPLTADQLIPNLAMKEVVDNFLSENPWAIDS
ncbi:hypothetical protein AB6A40_001624 [Gnathostoma spinigerum]|uniref:E3 ubiquitin-protein ligase CHIP n=1 Tax=Gnathostoma spinigerum TaxID=75299 RepID=A0ABD6E4L4_9BILA